MIELLHSYKESVERRKDAKMFIFKERLSNFYIHIQKDIDAKKYNL